MNISDFPASNATVKWRREDKIIEVIEPILKFVGAVIAAIVLCCLKWVRDVLKDDKKKH